MSVICLLYLKSIGILIFFQLKELQSLDLSKLCSNANMGAYFLIYVDCKITKSIYFFTCCLMEVFKGSVSDPSLTVPTVYFHVV